MTEETLKPAAWDETAPSREYVDMLKGEIEAQRLRLSDAQSALAEKDKRIAELEALAFRMTPGAYLASESADEAARLRALLAEAREVVEPFAALPDNAHGKQRYFLQLLMCPEGDVPADGTRHYGPAIRAARTLAEKLEKEIGNE